MATYEISSCLELKFNNKNKYAVSQVADSCFLMQI